MLKSGTVFFILIIYFIVTTNVNSYPTPTGCTPFGLRLALGRTFYDSN